MNETIAIQAPAKINLHLEVGGLRGDRYHQLISLFQAVSLYDSLTFRRTAGSGECIIRGNCLLPMEKNVVFHAYKAFMKETGLNAGVAVDLVKEIPEGSGLGGGSSDAAATLFCLDRLFRQNMDGAVLEKLAARLGSDVVFFLKAEAALVTGRGERVMPLTPRSDFHIVIVYPDFHVSTVLAYGWLDEARKEDAHEYIFGMMPEEIAVEYRDLHPSVWRFFNSFEPVIKNRFPVLNRIEEDIKSAGAHITGISGSGSSVFGLFSERSTASKAALPLMKKYAKVFVVEPLDKMPQPVVL
ncbi:MAG: 4-(cytidine 5'-diphospho)-2-C-methyl-D-erythritol kinase [Spirochaetales bacterium]|nr:4-(cytidine 5'-diphospho)-2-C-methyl-D-erythritol kinase [Spirochaetales bacterium]